MTDCISYWSEDKNKALVSRNRSKNWSAERRNKEEPENLAKNRLYLAPCKPFVRTNRAVRPSGISFVTSEHVTSHVTR